MPPNRRPWTQFDKNGDDNPRPPFKACLLRFPLIFFGVPCWVCEFEAPSFCCGGPDGDHDRFCDVVCRCRCNRCLKCICCGPQCDERTCKRCPCCCCRAVSPMAKAKVQRKNCCSCCDAPCGRWRMNGCKVCCCHASCVRCPPCCNNCGCCREERLMMDGDLKPIPKLGDAPKPVDATRVAPKK